MIKINKNVLSDDLSPYLKQHKDNPVNWQTWSKEILEFSKQNKKPILLSIGYASCHWCHVMAHESFEDNETAKLMNELFINIKVDFPEYLKSTNGFRIKDNVTEESAGLGGANFITINPNNVYQINFMVENQNG